MTFANSKLFLYVVLSYSLAVAGSVYLSEVAFVYFKHSFEQLKDNGKTSHQEESAKKMDEPKLLTQLKNSLLFSDCLKQHIGDNFNCRQYVVRLINVNSDAVEEKHNVFNAIGSNSLILLIEDLLKVGLFIQVFLTLYTLFLKKFDSFDKYVFHLSDWAINTPPILGVLANLVSFSLLLSHEGNIQSVFSGYFFQAVITTLIGGVFYIINLALKVVIHARIE